jgi:hypothetical protein
MRGNSIFISFLMPFPICVFVLNSILEMNLSILRHERIHNDNVFSQNVDNVNMKDFGAVTSILKRYVASLEIFFVDTVTSSLGIGGVSSLKRRNINHSPTILSYKKI